MLEDFAVARAERDLRSLIDRAPRVAHRRQSDAITDIPVDDVAVGDILLVQGGEVIPVDGMILGHDATIDESALTGEPIPVTRHAGEAARSGAVNAGKAFEIRTTALAGEAPIAGIVRMANAAQTAKRRSSGSPTDSHCCCFQRALALPAPHGLLSGDPVRALAVLVAATPCPLILAAPVAFIAGVARAARLGILIKGGQSLEALARTHTVMFDKTGTLTVGGARLVAVEVAPGEDPDTVLRLAASLEQASHHVVAAAVVQAAARKDCNCRFPPRCRRHSAPALRERWTANSCASARIS